MKRETTYRSTLLLLIHTDRQPVTQLITIDDLATTIHYIMHFDRHQKSAFYTVYILIDYVHNIY